MNQKLRNNEYFNVQGRFDTLYAESKKGRYFKKLYDLIVSEENILLAFRNMKSNTGSKTKGSNGHTIKHLNKMNKDMLIKMARRKLENYKPEMVRRVMIPKPNGEKRPLGIPTIEDRLIQQMILQVLEPIVEAKFHPYQIRGQREPTFTIYDKDDRQRIHRELIHVTAIEIEHLRRGNFSSKSTLYENNRISKYVAQKGKCHITGERLMPINCVCHHILPTKMGGTDEYDNLVIIKKDYHTLIHTKFPMKDPAKVKLVYSLDEKVLKKLNKLRKVVGFQALVV